MLKNYFKTALRNLLKNKFHSFLNITGLSVGMAVAMLIGLWIWDELSFDKNFANHDQIAMIWQNVNNNGETGTWSNEPFPLGAELRKNYTDNFQQVVMGTYNESHILSLGDKKLSQSGTYFEPGITGLLSMQMLKGSRDGLKDPHSILLSASFARAWFGDEDPMNKTLKIDNRLDVKVSGVYKDFPVNSSFAEVSFMAPFELLAQDGGFDKRTNPWRSNSFFTYVQIAGNTTMEQVSEKIRDVKMKNVHQDELIHHPQLFLHPMRHWHLYSDFRNGVNAGGRIRYVWLFGISGLFVLLLACINFMNLSTARSEKRAKEVGIRKAIGSLRGQLIGQFFSESLLMVALALLVALILAQLMMPLFNEVSGKKISILWSNPMFWLMCLCFCLITGLIAGSYPALYLSSFRPIKVLKGTFRVGRWAATPRKVLVVLQFTVSVTLIIGTIIVFRQIRFAQNRPIGYDRNGLITVSMYTTDIHDHIDRVRDELMKTGAVSEMSESAAPPTAVWSTNSGFDWKGKDPGLAVDFPNTEISSGYGRTVGWQFREGRDFSRDFLTDSSAFVINETAAKFMGLKDPVGQIVKWDGHPFIVIGVIKDMIVESPYDMVRPHFFHLSKYPLDLVLVKINPVVSASEALGKIGKVFRANSPAQPFEYKFVDEEYARKFGDEQRIGKLSALFAVLAIFISCLGLFGMASFMAEQRTKEIGLRKVLGASVFNLWRLLSRDFVFLVLISLLVAMPLAWYFMNGWLQHYQYRSGMPWWVFAAAGAGAILITLFTVSYQAVRAALANPVRSLRTE
ncbi:MAG TPA: ABC transporter permease [Puia sp.]|nr:ABC transporter permease [Puia sp.]